MLGNYALRALGFSSSTSSAAWLEQMDKSLAQTRDDLGKWIRLLECEVHEFTGHEDRARQDRAKRICECSRMVLMYGVTLYTRSSVRQVVTRERCPGHDQRWAERVALHTLDTLEKAVECVNGTEYAKNVSDRYQDAIDYIAEWLPTLELGSNRVKRPVRTKENAVSLLEV